MTIAAEGLGMWFEHRQRVEQWRAGNKRFSAGGVRFVLPLVFLWAVLSGPCGCHGGGCVNGENGDEVVLQDILSATRRIRIYSVETTTRIRPPGYVPRANAEGGVPEIVSECSIRGETGRRLRIDMKLSPPPDVPAPTTHFVVVFDGTWQWVQTTREEATSVLKVRIREVSPDPSTQPFNTGFFVTGSGLVAGEDLPGTVVSLVKMYDMRQLPADDERVEKDQFVFVGIANSKDTWSALNKQYPPGPRAWEWRCDHGASSVSRRRTCGSSAFSLVSRQRESRA